MNMLERINDIAAHAKRTRIAMDYADDNGLEFYQPEFIEGGAKLSEAQLRETTLAEVQAQPQVPARHPSAKYKPVNAYAHLLKEDE